MSESGKHHLLLGVPSSTKEYAYLPNCFRNVYQKHWDMLEKDKTSEESPYIIFTGVDNETFSRDFEEGGNHCDTYIPSLGLVLVDMITPQHERAHRQLDKIIQWHINEFANGIDDGLQYTGQASRTSEDREKRPDTSYQPVYLPSGRSDKWPSLVIEAGWSETRAKLEHDARWWIGASKGDVKGVITAAVQQGSRSIILEYWHSVLSPLRSDPDKRVIKLTHRTTISQGNKNSPIQVSNVPFIIPFEDMFLRGADANTKEYDIVISREELELYAIRVWKD
ncbi:hypothetical protein UA08_05807 [Talaromyces atroroseus]|uniref:Uncharacterized protein n=1 Tax=Talaromyces atroroseus TaxID=1441469 RepID=A0A225APF9_TALAT|nr:hypothetical protein UA08_05807 [Talaromyces atroroseus]OKL59168.1 hypothetical protein UA08_05807 [Talaromyces atroroseus]